MPTLSEKVRQLAPHWAVMVIIMYALLAVIQIVYGQLSFWQSVLLVVFIAFAYPTAVRMLGVAPEVWDPK